MSACGKEDELQKLLADLKTALRLETSDPYGPTYQSLRKLNAKCLLRVNSNYEAAYNLVEALAPSVRTMAAYRCDSASATGDTKTMDNMIDVTMKDMLEKINPEDFKDDKLLSYLLETNKDLVAPDDGAPESRAAEEEIRHHIQKKYIQHPADDDVEMIRMREKLTEMPDEWTVVQLTAGHEPCELWETQRVIRSTVQDFHLTLLKGGTLGNLEPYTVTMFPELVKVGERPVFEELHSTLEENLFVIENNLRATNNSLKRYWEKRADSDLRIKGVILTMDRKWLGGWRCLLRGKLLAEDLNAAIIKHVDQACIDNTMVVSPVQRMLLLSLAGAAHLTTPTETSLTLRKIYLQHGEPPTGDRIPCLSCGEVRRVADQCVGCCAGAITAGAPYKMFRKTFLELLNTIKYDGALAGLKDAKRGPVILLVDEKLDTFPWEMLPVLNGQPVTRMECLAFLHGLYSTHINSISHGYFQLRPDKGSFLINPGGDLDKMEKRMSAFIDYWCPEWEGDKNRQPPPDQFQKYLQESDVFLYCGHNDGSQYMGGGAHQLRAARAVTTLSGCGSVRLRSPGTRLQALPVHAHYHLATCPSVIGMLWEVTDLEVDKVTSMLLGLFLPSRAPNHWGNVLRTYWTKASQEGSKAESSSKFVWEPDLLRALAAARRYSSYAMIAASVVARGLPVRIHPDYQLPEKTVKENT